MNDILLVYSGEIVNRWHSAALFVDAGRRSQHVVLLHIFITVCHTAEVRSVLCPVEFVELRFKLLSFYNWNGRMIVELPVDKDIA